MHEYSIARALLDSVEAEAGRRGATAVTALTLKLGELSGVEPQLLLSAYELCRERSIAERATLAIVPVAALWACPHCARPISRGAVLRCPDCQRPAHLAAGDEIVLERIEMEVP